MGRLSLTCPLPWLFACLTLAAGLWAQSSRADEAEPAALCPSSADVVAGLRQTLAANPEKVSLADIVIRDLGDTWEIELRGHKSTYSDPAHNCAERARVATVFAALVLEPLDTGRAGDRVTARVSRAAPPRHVQSNTIELAPLLVVAVGTRDRDAIAGVGGQGRASLSGEHLGLSVGAEVAVFDELDLHQYGASITRAALDLSARLSCRFAHLGLAAELGPYVGLLRVRGIGLFEDQSSAHVDAGARWAALARLRGSRLGPFVALQAELGARRFDLTVDPSGSVGSAPRLWLGLVLGAALYL